MSFHKKFCNWASQKKININKVTYKRAENAFIDTLACILSGVKEKQSKVALKYCLENNNSKNIKIFGGGKKLSISAACFLHGVRSASIDFDDYEYVAGSHPSAPIFSALISLAQMKNISIEETYQGWVVGYELIIKLGQALSYDHYYKGWHSANTIGVIGTAAAVSKVLKLNADQMANAISIATSFSSGLKQQFGTDIKAFHVGFASQAGVQSALLAKNGGTANQDIWNIERGFIELYGSKFSKKLNNNFKKSDLGNAIIKLFETYLKLKEETNDNADPQSLKLTPFESIRSFLDNSKNYFPTLEQASMSIRAKSNINDAANIYFKLCKYVEDKLKTQIKVLPKSIMENLFSRYDPHRGRILISEALDIANKSFQIASQIALIEFDDLINEIIIKSNLNHLTKNIS